MGYLVLSRREGEEIKLTVEPGVDAETLFNLLVRDGITITLAGLQSNQARIAIDAPRAITVLRGELVPKLAT
jgi:sRNA-binding carbon storage regulator CsrA